MVPNQNKDLLKIFLLKETRKNVLVGSLLRIYSDCIVRNNKLTIQISKMELFTESLAREIIKSGQFDNDWKAIDQSAKISRVKSDLSDLMNHLIGENEDFIAPMQIKIDKMKKMLKVHKILEANNTTKLPKKMFVSKLKLKNLSKNVIESIVIKGGENRTSSISSITHHLKQIIEQQRDTHSRLKRDMMGKCVVKIRQLIVDRNSSFIKGLFHKYLCCVNGPIFLFCFICFHI